MTQSQTQKQTASSDLTVTKAHPLNDRVFTPEALSFLNALEEKFGAKRQYLMSKRVARQKAFDAGALPDFDPETKAIREGDWKVAPVPEALQDRRVEITGPVDRKMMINALNSGAKVFMADFEDANSPTFANVVEGQVNVQDYARGALSYTDPSTGKAYACNAQTALMIIRPRGWHLDEAHITKGGQPVSGSLTDFGLHIFHNGKVLHEKGLGPFYYLPKIESYEEARLWNEVFVFAQEKLGLALGTIKATVLIETLPAAFVMDEILYELKDHIAGLNCGRWDYIFSYIKTLRNHEAYILPDRAQVTMNKDFLLAYSQKLIETCHRRGAHAMGGMAAQIPIKNDEAANAVAFDKVRADKEREAKLGHDGTWVAHPALVEPAMEIFNTFMPDANQKARVYDGPDPVQTDMLKPHEGTITEQGVRTNIAVGIEYIAAWLGGRGAVPINNLMEDAATAEISRVQIWQWLKFSCTVESASGESQDFTRSLFDLWLEEEFSALRARASGDEAILKNLDKARSIFVDTILGDSFYDFLTLPAYQTLCNS